MKVGGPAFFQRAEFAGPVDFVNASIGSSFAADEAQFNSTKHKANFSSMKVEGAAFFTKAVFAWPVTFNGMNVGGDVFFNKAEFAGPVEFISAEIYGNLDLTGSTLPSIDLTGTQIGIEFVLQSIQWSEGSKMTLRNTKVGFLKFRPDSWPDTFELDGFTYTRLGMIDQESASGIVNPDISILKKWLKKQLEYTPQPYEHLASVLRNEGFKGQASDILFAGKWREHGEINIKSPIWWWLAPQLLFIGYGYRIYYAIFWFFGLVALGVIILRVSGQGRANKMPYGIAYSLDMLLPLVKLREHHYDIDLSGWARYYFYFHILMGYALGLFLISGLSGLIK